MAELHLVIGRQRLTSATLNPAAAGYIQAVAAQTKIITDNMKASIKYIEDVTAEAIAFGLKPIYDKSQQYVPVDTGALKRSGYVEVRRLAAGPTAEIGYGRYGRPPYAIYVHEIPMRHRKGQTHKFLEKAVDEHMEDFRRRVELYVKREFAKVEGRLG